MGRPEFDRVRQGRLFGSMMISEHASQIWENIPNPELIIAAAALQTKTIKFAPDGAYPPAP
jgi:alkanesulfonate monooxygenase SsuD/methylene tetrahydromethanopterin reductase-like flavin-dependent oxidoreductase (luciferase family)